jgi:hypothetical protein
MFKNYFIESKLLEDLPMLCKQTLGAIQSVSAADRLPCHGRPKLGTYEVISLPHTSAYPFRTLYDAPPGHDQARG